MKNLIIIGAQIQGQAGFVYDILKVMDSYHIVGFLDNNESLHNKNIYGIKVLGYANSQSIKKYSDAVFHIAVGDNIARYRLYRQLKKDGREVVSIIHPSVIIGSDVSTGEGIFIGPNVVIGHGVQLGNASIVSTSAIIDPMTILGEGVYIGSASNLGSRCKIYDYSYIGMGTTIIPDIQMGTGSLIRAGSLIMKDILGDFRAL